MKPTTRARRAGTGEQLHDDECYRDVHGVPTGSCLCLVLAIVIVFVTMIMIMSMI